MVEHDVPEHAKDCHSHYRVQKDTLQYLEREIKLADFATGRVVVVREAVAERVATAATGARVASVMVWSCSGSRRRRGFSL